MSDEGRVTPAEEVRDISPREVTPDSGEGALGTWRASSVNTIWTLSQTVVGNHGGAELEV